MKKFAVQITRETRAYHIEICVDTVIEAESPVKALAIVLRDYDLQGAPDKVSKIFDETEEEFHGMTGDEFSYDVCVLDKGENQ